ncbi:hypothetical protein G6F36_012918 [Rhizopus arrhizus]|nr:hypothetical protein G6F36_012918 [Rhizopus arrhizus]
MSNDKENTKTNASDGEREQCKDLAKEYFFVNVQYEGTKELNSMKKKLKIKQQLGESSAVRIVERDKHFVPEKEESVGSVIKTKACTLRKEYHDLDSNRKAIVSLGLNSILDLSYKYPDAQSTLFNNRQWLHLKRTNKPKEYVSTEYAYISEILKPIFKAYNPAKTSDENLKALYVQTKTLMEQNDPEIDILMAVKHEPGLFSDTVNSSEWDYIVKFWGPITQRLFYFSGLRLKWGDTHLTLHDTIGDIVLKVDLRIIHDSIKQRYNVENEVGVAEVAEENPGSIYFGWLSH